MHPLAAIVFAGFIAASGAVDIADSADDNSEEEWEERRARRRRRVDLLERNVNRKVAAWRNRDGDTRADFPTFASV